LRKAGRSVKRTNAIMHLLDGVVDGDDLKK
jgi:hypothetical protein